MTSRVCLALVVMMFAACTFASAQSAGRMVSYKPLPSSLVDSREVDIWLPPGYDQEKTARYPVLYMHDGQNLFDSRLSYTGVPWGVDAAIARLAAQEKIRAAIVVGIWNTPIRFGEYMPQKAVSARNTSELQGIPFPTHDEIISDQYLKFIVQDLKPFVDANYRTLADRANTFIMGSSMGGLISAYAEIEYPDVFGGAACLSTHWPIGDGASVVYFAAHLPDPKTHKFYFDHGTATLDAQYTPFQQKMDEAMKSKGYIAGQSWLSRVFKGADHSERSWNARIDVPLEFLLGK